MKYGLLGKSLSHSFSPQIHERLGSFPYELIEKNENEVIDFLETKNFTGINVTIPYKRTAFEKCDEVDEISKKVDCVNTVIVRGDKLSGYNTDYHGFIYMLKFNDILPVGKSVVIVGNGATAKTVEVALRDSGCTDIRIISRRGKHGFGDFEYYKDANILVNCTPLGSFPNVNVEFPIDISKIGSLDTVVDLNYNPIKTKLLIKAEELGHKIYSGMLMLVAQAKISSELMQNKKIDDKKILEIYDEIKEGKYEKNFSN